MYGPGSSACWQLCDKGCEMPPADALQEEAGEVLAVSCHSSLTLAGPAYILHAEQYALASRPTIPASQQRPPSQSAHSLQLQQDPQHTT